MINDDFEGKEFLDIPGTVYISGKAHIPPEAKEGLFTKLAEKGYELNKDGTYASLKNIHAAECRHCNSIISVFGVAAHNHKCEACGKPTNLDYVPDGIVSFYFRRDGYDFGNSISFRIY